jgi:tripartite-type tricarboxylate transporter receptor subunit TctC
MTPSIVVVHPALPVKSVGDLVKLANAKPGAINYASAGSGSATFLSTELFKGRANVDLVHVPYRGGGEAITSVIAGETSVYFAPLATALEHARNRPLLPALPTLAESGYAGAESGSWYGIVLPVKTPKAAVAALHAAAIKALNQTDVRKRLLDLGYVIIGDQPDQFAAHIRAEIDILGKIIKRTGAAVN